MYTVQTYKYVFDLYITDYSDISFGTKFILERFYKQQQQTCKVRFGGEGWGGGGDETFPKFSERFAESFAKIL